MKIFSENKKTLFNYEVKDTIEAGLVLKGFEVKAVREGKANLKSAFITIRNNHAIAKNLQISRYSKASGDSDPGRDKILLIHITEIRKIEEWISQGSQTVVPIKLYEKEGKVKLEIALVRGKKQFEKRRSIKERDINR